jgi:hypothetical protein
MQLYEVIWKEQFVDKKSELTLFLMNSIVMKMPPIFGILTTLPITLRLLKLSRWKPSSMDEATK